MSSHYIHEKRETTLKAQAEPHQKSVLGTQRSWVVLCLWAIFAAGLLIQMAAPRLKIENRAFVMPPISNGRGPMLRPDALVRRERWMQSLSGIFTVGGAIALGVFYRRALITAVKG
jgi:hypothetical protein